MKNITRWWIGASMALAAAGASQVASAQSSVSLYGVIDEYVAAQKSLGKERAWAVNPGGMSTSFWGIGGREDLGNGYAAVFALEAFFQPNNGNTGRFAGDTFFGRNAYVGLATPYGSFLLGRNTTPYYVSALRFNPFSTSFGFSPVLTHMYKGVSGQGLAGDNGWNNSLLYTSPGGNDWQASLIYGTGNKAGAQGQNQWGGNAIYAHGPFSATVAYQQVRYDKTPGDLTSQIAGFNLQSAVMAAVGYDFSVVKFTALYQYVHDSIDSGDLNTHSGQIGASVPIGNGALLASWMFAKSHGRGDPLRSTWSVGYDYRLSKRTDLYAAYLQDRATGYTSGNTAGVGMRMAF